MKVLITGGAGFIGSNLADFLMSQGHSVTIVDNFSTGQREFLKEKSFEGQVIELDLRSDLDKLAKAMDGAEVVFHLAANADVRHGWEHSRLDLDQNVVATLNVAEAARQAGARRLLFSSTGSVYGESQQIPTPEDSSIPVQTSLYGASKFAAEGFLGAYAEAGIFKVSVFRFVSILGPRYTHGHIIDFCRQLRKDPNKLRILGDGNQRKSYLEVSDCVSAITSRMDSDESFEVFNLGADNYCTVKDSVGWICGRLEVAPTFEYTGGDRGWIGDNPFIWLETSKIRSTGWTPKYSIQEAVERTVDYLMANSWVLDIED